MKNLMRVCLLAGAMTMVIVPPALSHHSHAMFDHTREVSVTGTVTQWLLRNPHAFLYIDVKDVSALFEKLKDCDVILPLEKTFYGATHFFIREPGWHVLGFSENE